jgi:hypothetical protein
MLTKTKMTIVAALVFASASEAMAQSYDPSIGSGNIAPVPGQTLLSHVNQASLDRESKPAIVGANRQFVDPMVWIKLTHLVGKRRKPLYLNVEQIVRIGDAVDVAAGYLTSILLTNGSADVFEDVEQVMQLVLRPNVSPPADAPPIDPQPHAMEPLQSRMR